jgi:hypothetical protein
MAEKRKIKKTKDDSKFKASSLCGISEQRAEEITKSFRHGMIETDKWTDLVNWVIKVANIQGQEEHMFLGYTFGRLYEKDNNTTPHGLMEALLGGHVHK